MARLAFGEFIRLKPSRSAKILLFQRIALTFRSSFIDFISEEPGLPARK
jgi:hypothetical protein